MHSLVFFCPICCVCINRVTICNTRTVCSPHRLTNLSDSFFSSCSYPLELANKRISKLQFRRIIRPTRRLFHVSPHSERFYAHSLGQTENMANLDTCMTYGACSGGWPSNHLARTPVDPSVSRSSRRLCACATNRTGRRGSVAGWASCKREFSLFLKERGRSRIWSVLCLLFAVRCAVVSVYFAFRVATPLICEIDDLALL